MFAGRSFQLPTADVSALPDFVPGGVAGGRGELATLRRLRRPGTTTDALPLDTTWRPAVARGLHVLTPAALPPTAAAVERWLARRHRRQRRRQQQQQGHKVEGAEGFLMDANTGQWLPAPAALAAAQHPSKQESLGGGGSLLATPATQTSNPQLAAGGVSAASPAAAAAGEGASSSSEEGGETAEEDEDGSLLPGVCDLLRRCDRGPVLPMSSCCGSQWKAAAKVPLFHVLSPAPPPYPAASRRSRCRVSFPAPLTKVRREDRLLLPARQDPGHPPAAAAAQPAVQGHGCRPVPDQKPAAVAAAASFHPAAAAASLHPAAAAAASFHPAAAAAASLHPAAAAAASFHPAAAAAAAAPYPAVAGSMAVLGAFGVGSDPFVGSQCPGRAGEAGRR